MAESPQARDWKRTNDPRTHPKRVAITQAQRNTKPASQETSLLTADVLRLRSGRCLPILPAKAARVSGCDQHFQISSAMANPLQILLLQAGSEHEALVRERLGA